MAPGTDELSQTTDTGAETAYDSLLFVSFGGPEGREEVVPFLENVLRGRNVPRERMLEVAEHYYHFGGVSPINRQTRELIAAVREELNRSGIALPISWGNRNWRPLLPDTLRQMAQEGRRRAIAFVVSAYSSYSSCRQYRENIAAAQEAVGEHAPRVDKLRTFYNHPDFIAANAERLREGIDRLPVELRGECEIAFTAHSIPVSMGQGCDYVRQLTETCRLVAESVGREAAHWRLVYQSRSGRAEDPWLGPDILDHLRERRAARARAVVIQPVGFLSDHMEVLYDLDEEARHLCDELGLTMSRAGTVGTHPRFVTMIRKLVEERLDPAAPREAVGQYGPGWDACAADCCPAPRRPAART